MQYGLGVVVVLNTQTNPVRGHAAAFTLIELLVVIAIIVALLAILMPSLGKAQEAAARTVCASNLHQQAAASVNFASDHFGQFPVAAMWPDNPSNDRSSFYMYNYNPATEANDGTSMQTLRRYGYTGGIIRCPSSGVFQQYVAAFEAGTYGDYRWHASDPTMIQNYNVAADTGTWYRADDYMYVSGSRPTGLWANNPSRVQPAQRASAAGQRIIAADAVVYNTYGQRWMASHATSTGLPAWQNLAYADAAVRSLSTADFRASILSDPTKRNDAASWGGDGYGLGYYWEGDRGL